MELDWEAVYVWQPETLTGWRRCWCVEVLPWASSSSPSWISSRKNFWTASASFRSGSCSTKNIQPAGRRSDHSSLSDLTGSHSATYRNTFRGFKEIYFVNYMMWTGFLMNRQKQNVTHNNNILLDNPPSQRDQVWVFSFNKQNKNKCSAARCRDGAHLCQACSLFGHLLLSPPCSRTTQTVRTQIITQLINNKQLQHTTRWRLWIKKQSAWAWCVCSEACWSSAISDTTLTCHTSLSYTIISVWLRAQPAGQWC